MAPAKSLICRPQGDKNSLSLEDVPLPEIQGHQVLVKILAVAQNPTDIQSFDTDVFGDGAVLGCDFCGIVEEVGDQVKRLKIGDRIGALVWGGEVKGVGAYGTHCIADEKICYHVPEAMAPAEASTIPLALNTAWLAFFSSTSLHIDRSMKQENEVLVWGGSSSVGLYALQIAKIFCFNVATVCSPRNFDLCKNSGASHVFDYHSPTVIDDIKKALPNLTYVFDTIGNETSSVTASKAVREQGGTLCTVRPGKVHCDNIESRAKATDVLVWTAFLKEHKYKTAVWPPSEEDHKLSAEMYEALPQWLQDGQIKPNKPRVLGGLDKVKNGFQLNRDNAISAEKVVYVLE